MILFRWYGYSKYNSVEEIQGTNYILIKYLRLNETFNCQLCWFKIYSQLQQTNYSTICRHDAYKDTETNIRTLYKVYNIRNKATTPHSRAVN